MADPSVPKLYDQLASWWPLLSRPADYVEEAAFYADTLRGDGDLPADTLLELGSGGGNNASHLTQHFVMTLVDPSPGMLAESRALNPGCEHLAGDMRTIRLDRVFDRVFIHDAICYMTSLDDLRRAMVTAFVHCRPGGAALFAPDHVRETFRPGTDSGGHDGRDRGLRYLSGRGTPNRTTRPMWSTTPTCFENVSAACASSTTATWKDCLLAPTGCRRSPRSGSPRGSYRSTIPSSNPGRMNFFLASGTSPDVSRRLVTVLRRRSAETC